MAQIPELWLDHFSFANFRKQVCEGADFESVPPVPLCNTFGVRTSSKQMLTTYYGPNLNVIKFNIKIK